MTGEQAGNSVLAGLRVLEIGDSDGLAYAGRLLAGFGAEVLKVELPGGDSSRRRVAPPAAPGADGLLHRWLNGGKRSTVIDWERGDSALVPLLAGADVVLSAVPLWGPGTLAPTALRARWPHLLVAHVSDFGPDGPMASWAGGELVLYALSGLLAASGAYDRPPVAHGTGIAWMTSGAATAVGVLVSLWEAGNGGPARSFDVAGLDAMIGAQAALPFAVSFTGVSNRRGGKMPRVELGVFECTDGYIGSVIGRDGWERLIGLMDEPELFDDRFLDPALRLVNMAEATGIIARRYREESRDHWFHGAQALRMPFAKVQSARDLDECPQLAARGFFGDVEGHDGVVTRLPGRPFVMSASPWAGAPAPLLGSTAAGAIGWDPRPARPARNGSGAALRPLEGVRVIELGTAWAGPCGTKILADLGADVIKIESPSHPDNARVPPYTDGEPTERFFDRNCAFAIANTSKAHVGLELSSERGREVFRRLVAGADVVFENYTPHVMRDFGLTYEELRRINPALVMLSSCGYGHSGPWSEYAAYGWSLEPASGIADVTGYPDGPPVPSAIPYPDMAGALHGALGVLLGLIHRRNTGEGQWIDLAQYELAAVTALAPLLQHLATGERWGRHGNRHPWFAPHNIYPSAPDGTALGAEDNWVAIAVEDDGEWPRLVAALGGALPARPEWATFAGRKAAEDEIDACLSAWTAQRTKAEAAAILQAAGVRAAPVNRYDETLCLPQLWHRGFIVRAEHQEGGVRVVPGIWQRFEGRPAAPRWATPNFGAQNRLVLQGVLGLSNEEVEAMYAAGELAERPTTLEQPLTGGPPIEVMVELGLARGMDPGYRELNAGGPFVPLPATIPLTWGPVGARATAGATAGGA